MTEATFTVKVNIRSSPMVLTTNDVGDIYAGDRVYGVVSGDWIKFSKVYRADGGVVDFGEAYAAVQNPNNSTTKYAVLKDVPEPTPTPEPAPARKPMTVTFESEEFETATITLQPK